MDRYPSPAASVSESVLTAERFQVEQSIDAAEIGDLACTIGDSLLIPLRTGNAEAVGRIFCAAYEAHLVRLAQYRACDYSWGPMPDDVAREAALRESLAAVVAEGVAMLTATPLGVRQ